MAQRLLLFLFLAAGLVSGCASAGRVAVASDEVSADGAVEMVVRNRTSDVVRVFVNWEDQGGGGIERSRRRLGDLQGGATETFRISNRWRKISLSVDPLQRTGVDPARPPVPGVVGGPIVEIEPGDRFAWEILRIGVLHTIRLTAHTGPDSPVQAQSQAQEVSPEDRAAIEAGPVAFRPLTIRPKIRNRDEVIQASMREYPRNLRDAGVGGEVVLWCYISDTGLVLHTRIAQSSGHNELDQAALRVSNVFRFTPAIDPEREEGVAVWIRLPINFAVRERSGA